MKLLLFFLLVSLSACAQPVIVRHAVAPVEVRIGQDTTGGIEISQGEIFTSNQTAFSVLLEWNDVPNAHFYKVYRDGVYLTEVTSPGTWAWHEEGAEYMVQALDVNDVVRGYRTATILGYAQPAGQTIQGDYRTYQSITVGSTTTIRGKTMRNAVGSQFTAADKGKCISIAFAGRKSWYGQGLYWWHGFIEDAGTEWAIIKDSLVGSKYAGDPIDGLQPVTSWGYVATNRLKEMRDLVNADEQRIIGLDTVYVDPFRDSLYVADILATQEDPAALVVDCPWQMKIEGVFRFGEEQQFGQALYGSNRYSGGNPTGWTAYYHLKMFRHVRGTLGFEGEFYGPRAVPIRNQSNYHYQQFYVADITSPYLREFHFKGVFGDSTNYETGFVNFAINSSGQRPTNQVGKDVIAVYNSTVSCAESFSVRPWVSDSVGAYYNKRLLLRKSRLIGSAFQKMGQRGQASIVAGQLRVDSVNYPYLSLHEMSDYTNSNYVIMKRPGDAPGPMNQYTNAFARGYVAVSPYTAELIAGSDSYGMHAKPLVTGETLDVVLDIDMQRGIVTAGHVAYPQAAMEIEFDSVYVREYNAFLLRASDAPSTKGTNRQFSMNNITGQATNTRFDWVRNFGGYVQWSPTVDVGFGGLPSAQAQGGANLQYGISRNSDVNWQVKNIVIYPRNEN